MSHQPPAGIVSAARATARQGAVIIPPSVSLGQWALESEWGTRSAGPHNWFGMKALAGQPSVLVLTHETYKGVSVEVHAAFRAFTSDLDAFAAHARLLATGAAYDGFRRALPDVRSAIQLLGGGTPQHPAYATDPHYGSSLWGVISGSSLTQYDGGL